MRLPYIMAVAIAALALCSCEGTGPTSKHGDYGSGLRVIDGDTFIGTDDTDWRLARIDAPEMPNHPCHGYRVEHNTCPTGDPFVAKSVLQALLHDGAPIKCKRVDVDVYQRNIGECYMRDGRNISDTLLRMGVVEEYRK